MRKTKLVVDYHLGASVIGIVTTLKDYKLAWSINQVYSINLIMQPPLLMEFVKEPDLLITHYLYETEFQQFRLIKNRGNDKNQGLLIKELPNFDFFLLISDEGSMTGTESVVEQLRSINGIDFVQVIDVDKLVSKDNFIF